MECRHGSRGKQVANGVRNLNFQNAGVIQAGSLDPACGAAYAARHAFNPKKISSWVCRRGPDQKQSIAATKIDL
jgi:hypothetical protein